MADDRVGATAVPGQTAPAPETERLGRKRLNLADVVGQSIGFVGPVFSAAFIIPFVAGANYAQRGAGIVTPLALIFAAIGIAGIAWIIAAYARRIAAAGAIYEYVTYGLGRTFGNLAGWVYYGGVAVLSVSVPLVIGGTTQGLFSLFGWDVSYWIFGLIYIVLVAIVLFLGVRPSVRAQLALVTVSVLFILGFMIYVVAKTPTNSFKAFDPGHSLNGASGLFYGLLYGLLVFVGFESAANLGEETDRPRRNIPLAIFLSLGLVTAYYVFVSYAQAAGFHFDPAKLLGSQGPFFDLAAKNEYGSLTLEKIMYVVVILDIFAVGLGTSLAATRGMFAMARDRRIPTVLSRVSRSTGTPYMTILLLAALSVISTLLVRLDHGVLPLQVPGAPKGALFPEWYPLFNWYASFGGFCLAAVYALVCISGVRGLLRFENPLPVIAAALIGGAAAVVAVYGGIHKVSGPNGDIKWATLIWLALGVAVTLWLRSAGHLREPVALAEGGVVGDADRSASAGVPEAAQP